MTTPADRNLNGSLPAVYILRKKTVQCPGYPDRLPFPHRYHRIGTEKVLRALLTDLRRLAYRDPQTFRVLAQMIDGAQPHLQPIPGETWRPVVGVPVNRYSGEGHYEVSDHGRVRSNRAISGSRILAPSENRWGFRKVALHLNGRKVSRTVASLVAAAFIGPAPAAGMVARHKNGEPGDDRAANLEYGWRGGIRYPREVK